MQCVILAGGLGTRISSVRSDIPKALIPVAGQPFAFLQLEWLAKQGITDVIYCIGHKGGMLEDMVGDGSAFGVRVSYSDEGEVLRGTGGAIRLAFDRGLLADNFLLLYADSYLPIDVGPIWQAGLEAGRALMVVIQNDGQWDKSNVRFGGGCVELYDKSVPEPRDLGMRHIDYGLSVVAAKVIGQRIPAETRYDLAQLYTALSVEGELAGYEVSNRFYEIGSPAGLAELEAYLALGDPPQRAIRSAS